MKGQRHCTGCKATITRERYRLLGVGRVLSENEAKANRARGYARSYIRRGLLQKQPCEVAGCECPPMMYHKDFSRPLEVTWMCKGHALEFGLAGPNRAQCSSSMLHMEL